MFIHRKKYGVIEADPDLYIVFDGGIKEYHINDHY
jgi:hypothetical protein